MQLDFDTKYTIAKFIEGHDWSKLRLRQCKTVINDALGTQLTSQQVSNLMKTTGKEYCKKAEKNTRVNATQSAQVIWLAECLRELYLDTGMAIPGVITAILGHKSLAQQEAAHRNWKEHKARLGHAPTVEIVHQDH